MHIKSIDEDVKFPCDQCDYKATDKGNLLIHKNQDMKVSSFLATNVITRQQGRVIYYCILNTYMKVSSFLVTNVTTGQQGNVTTYFTYT